jgi:hypothetical protein
MGGGAQRPVRRGNAPKKTGARSARARTRGQNPLVLSYIYLGYFVCLCVTICCGTLSYSFSFGNQTEQGRRDGGFAEGGIEMERYGKGQIGEGGCEYTYHCLSLI